MAGIQLYACKEVPDIEIQVTSQSKDHTQGLPNIETPVNSEGPSPRDCESPVYGIQLSSAMQPCDSNAQDDEIRITSDEFKTQNTKIDNVQPRDFEAVLYEIENSSCNELERFISSFDFTLLELTDDDLQILSLPNENSSESCLNTPIPQISMDFDWTPPPSANEVKARQIADDDNSKESEFNFERPFEIIPDDLNPVELKTSLVEINLLKKDAWTSTDSDTKFLGDFPFLQITEEKETQTEFLVEMESVPMPTPMSTPMSTPMDVSEPPVLKKEGRKRKVWPTCTMSLRSRLKVTQLR